MRAKRQEGVALVTAVLAVALGTLVTVAVMRELMLDIRRANGVIGAEQGYQYARGLEVWAQSILREDARLGGAVDHAGDIWAKGIPFIDVPGGRLTGRMVDLGGRFNLNNLVVNGEVQPSQVAIFGRLLTELGLNPDLAPAVVDWIDADIVPERQGAEDMAYLRADPPYRAANRPLLHPSELRSVAGFDRETYERLAPYIATVPTQGQPLPLNINTARAEVLAALDPALTLALAREIGRDGQARFKSIDAFLENPRLQERDLSRLRPLVTVESRHFLAEGIVDFNGVEQRYFAVLERSGGGTRTLLHSRGAF
ncbi:MAG: type II secretion system minor pseudopilin GspK [Pseudomonadota bacterium]